MSSLILCIKLACSRIMQLLGFQRKSESYSNSLDEPDEEKRIKNNHTSWHQEEDSTIHQRKHASNKQISISDTVEIEGLQIDDNLQNRRGKLENVPTKDGPFDVGHSSQIKPINEKITHQTFKINPQSFKIQLQPSLNFYGVLQSKTQNLNQKLNVTSTPIEINDTPYGLQINHSESGKLNVFTYRFKLPCTYSFYSQMLNDYVLQKKLDTNIDEYKMMELYSPNFRLNYLSYKKVLIVSPRDFVYLKYSSSNGNEYWDISFSIPWQNFANKIRGEIILSCCKVIEKNDEIEVEVYSEVDMKLSVSPKITKNQAVTQIKKYVEKCDKYVKENFKRQLL